MASTDGEKLVGCLMAVFSLLVTSPMWLFLLFGILTTLGDAVPTWLWVLYWAYVPCSVLGVMVAALAKNLMDE